MKKPVLVIKKSGGATLYQTPNTSRPGFGELWRTFRGKNEGVGLKNRMFAGAGLAGKVAALGGTAAKTASSVLRDGDVLAPLGAGYTYEGLDPTGKFMSKVQDSANQQREAHFNQAQPTPKAKGPARYNVPLPGQPKKAKPEWMNKPKGPTNVGVRQPGQAQPANPFVNNPTSPNVGGQTRGPAPVNTAVPPGMPGTVGNAMNQQTVGNAFGSAIAPAYPQTPTPQAPTPQAPTPQPSMTPPTPQAPTPQAPTPQPSMTPQVMGDAMNQHMQPPQGMAAQPAQPAKSPMDQAMASLRTNAQMPSYQQQATTPTSTANALSPSNRNNANEVLGSFYNTLSPDQQAHGGAVQGVIESQGNFATDQNWGQKTDLNQGLGQHQTTWNQDLPEWMKKSMLKAYIKKLYDEFGGYMYKMTPHEAGQFAVYTMFTLRK